MLLVKREKASYFKKPFDVVLEHSAEGTNNDGIDTLPCASSSKLILQCRKS